MRAIDRLGEAAMNKNPSETVHIEHFRKFGYAVVKGVFAADEVAKLARAFDRVYAEGMTHHASFRHQNTLFRIARDPNIGRIVRMVQWPSYFDPVLDGFRLDRRIAAILAPLLGGNLKQIINQMHWKPPGAAMVEFGYHQDIRFRRPRAAYRAPATSYIQTGIAVDPHCRDNGAMTVYPGSHNLGELPTGELGRIMERALSDCDLVRYGLEPTRAVDLVLDPGDVALWHLHLIHGSGPNTSGIERRFYLNGYVIAENCDRGEWAFRDGHPCPLGEPVLVHYEDLYRRPEPHYVEGG
jgi:ectoine hydroxylase-related dioxygenase (phytanoyl-CoA dioxygenase family)